MFLVLWPSKRAQDEISIIGQVRAESIQQPSQKQCQIPNTTSKENHHKKHNLLENALHKSASQMFLSWQHPIH